MSKQTDDQMNSWIRGQRTIGTFTIEPEPLSPDVAAINAEIRRVAGRSTEDEKEQDA